MEIISAATLLFLVLDPLGNIPVFLSVLEDVAPERRTRVLARELLLAFAVLLFLLFFGQYALGFLQLNEHSIRIAGGIILFLIAIKMVFPVRRSAWASDELHGEPLLVPLAIPMVAGPSAMAVVLSSVVWARTPALPKIAVKIVNKIRSRNMVYFNGEVS